MLPKSLPAKRFFVSTGNGYITDIAAIPAQNVRSKFISEAKKIVVETPIAIANCHFVRVECIQNSLNKSETLRFKFVFL